MRSESDMNSFQESLNDLLKEKGISRLKLANAIGISSTTINGYFNNQLVDYSEIKAINYIGFNSNENKNVIHNIFNNDVEIKSLFNRMKDEIKQLEPVNFGIYDKYTIELENVIGSVRNIDTNLLCIVTICGTKNIISMFPVLNKNRLNNKKIIKSKELSLK